MKTLDKIRHYYHVMGDLSHTNLVLKISLTVLGVCFLLSLFVIAKLALRPPLLITILPDGKAVQTAYEVDDKTTIEDSEVHRFIQKFLESKYNWTPETVESQLETAATYLNQDLHDQISKKISEDIAYVKNTEMTQHLYIKSIEAVDQKKFESKKDYVITGDRIIGIKDAKFTSDFKVVLTVKKIKRSSTNLSGLQVTALEETLSKKDKS